MWLSAIGVVSVALLTGAGYMMFRTVRRIEEFEDSIAKSTDHERRLKDLEVFKKQLEYSGEHAVVDVPPNVHPRVVDYTRENV